MFYSFTLPAGATDLDILLNMLSGSGNNVLQYAIWDACGGTEMFCNDFIAATGTTSVTGLTAGSSYILQVSSAETEVADFEIGLEANIPPCNAGDVSATLASTPITYCAGNTVNFETDGTEVLSAGQVYIWYLEDSGSGQLYGLVSNSGNNYSGDLEAVTDANSNPQQIVSLPPGTYDIFGAATDGTPTNSCLTSNIGTVTVLALNDPLCAPTCQVGDIAPAIANTTVTICHDGVITLQTDGNEVIPAGEEYLWVFVNQNTSAQTAVAIGPSYSGAINIDLGVGNELPAGTYDVYGALSDSSQTVVCGGVVTSSSFTLVILPTSDATCNPISCDITNLAPGAQTPCVASLNTYTQQVVVTFSDAPSTGMLEVNGQTFPIATSPQTVTLTGLDSDGAAVNVTASFTDETTCILTQNNLFVAPAACGSVGIQDLDLNALQIYPNPSKGMFNVAFDLASSKDINIKVISILGKELYRFEANNINGQFNHLVDLQDAIAGVYFVVISEGNKQSAHKIVIKK